MYLYGQQCNCIVCIQDTLTSRAQRYLAYSCIVIVSVENTVYSCMQDNFGCARTRPKHEAAAMPSERATCIQDTLSSRAALGLPAECVARAKVSCIQCLYLCARQNKCVFTVTAVNIRKVIF